MVPFLLGNWVTYKKLSNKGILSAYSISNPIHTFRSPRTLRKKHEFKVQEVGGANYETPDDSYRLTTIPLRYADEPDPEDTPRASSQAGKRNAHLHPPCSSPAAFLRQNPTQYSSKTLQLTAWACSQGTISSMASTFSPNAHYSRVLPTPERMVSIVAGGRVHTRRYCQDCVFRMGTAVGLCGQPQGSGKEGYVYGIGKLIQGR